MKREFIAFKTLLLTVIVLAIVSAQALVNHAAESINPQGGGGRVQPTPTPKKTTPPKKTATPARTNRTGVSKPPARQAEPGAEKTSAAEIAFWETIKDSKNPEEFRAYLKKYPNGEFADLARSRLNVLEAAREAAKKQPGVVVKNSIGLELVWVPPGSFLMGSEMPNSDEGPVHRVTFDNGFYIGRYEVTQAQWQTVMGSNPSESKGCDQCPVVYISWDNAQEFIRKLNAMDDGYVYRLPTESEWEYACRAGTTTKFAYGDSISSEQANFNGEYPFPYERPKGVNRNKATPVGSFQPNAWGLYDMHGNVLEWCEDVYHKDYYGAPADGSAWLSGGEQGLRVLRSGTWGWAGEDVRSANRFSQATTRRAPDIGLRVAAIPRTK